MHLILDGVFNHTSSDSMYFDRYGRYETVGACEALTSTYRSWYYFSPATPAGTGECAGDTTYEAWWGYDSLPKLNTTNVPAVRTLHLQRHPGHRPLLVGAGRRRLAARRRR